jgi:hypothetical protein
MTAAIQPIEWLAIPPVMGVTQTWYVPSILLPKFASDAQNNNHSDLPIKIKS